MSTNTDIETKNSVIEFREYLTKLNSDILEQRATAEDEDEYLYYESLFLEFKKIEKKFKLIFRSQL